MNIFQAIFDQAEQAASSRVVINDCDYMQDGLLYCGKCHSKKQVRVNVFDEEHTPYCLCKCEQAKRDEQECLQREKEREAQRNARVRELKSLSMMTSKLRASTFDAWQGNENIKAMCERYVNTFSDRLKKNQGLLLYGASGLGKTFASACIANALLEKGYSVVMTSFIKFVGSSQFDDNIQDLLRYMADVDLLILDDLGAERSSAYAIERVNEIIDSRSLQNKPLIISTNLSMRDMNNPDDLHYVRIYQRVFEICYPVLFEGKSYRLEKAKDNFYELQKVLKGEDDENTK